MDNEQFDPFLSEQGARASARRRNWLLIAALVVALVAAVCCFSFCGAPQAVPAPTPEPSLPAVDASFNGLTAYFLDVGQGDCTLLRSPSGKTMLVDAGPSGSFPRLRSLLTALGITKIDTVVCSHMHEDHIGSMAEIVRHYEIGNFYISPFDTQNSIYADLIDALNEENVAATPVYASLDRLLVWDEDVEVRALSPFEVHYDDYNDTSILLHVQYGTTAALLAGDATELSERIAIKAFPDHYLRANVLKVGHHGSKTSTSNRFLSAVKPELAVVSVGAENGYGLPDESVLQRLLDAGARVLRTDKDGTVRIALDGTRVWVVE